MLRKDEFDDWMQHPVTEMFRKHLKTMMDGITEDWANGIFTAESSEGTAQLNAAALGQVRLIHDILNLTEEDI